MSADTPVKEPWRPIEISLLIGSVLLITLAAFEGLATTTIMPNVVAEFQADSWFSIASGAALAAQLSATVVAGGLSDSRGPRRVLGYGVALFALGLLVSGCAPMIEIFVIGRIIQGVGGGLIIVPLYVFIGSIADPSHRPSFFAAFSLSWVLPGLVGPAIAGYAVSLVGWRPVFLAVPVLALIALFPLIGVLRALGAHEHSPSSLARLLRLAILAGGGVVLLQLSGALGGLPLVAVALLGLALTGIALPRLLPKGAFALRPGLPAAIMTRLLAMGAQAGAAAVLPLILQRVHDWEPESAALAVTIGTVSWSAGATLQSRITGSERRLRLPLIGVALLTLGILPIVALAHPRAWIWAAMLGWFIAGAGTGLMHSTLSVLSLDLTRPAEHGKVASWLQVADASGAAIELAIMSIIMAAWNSLGTGAGLAYLPAPLIAFLFALVALGASTRISTGAAPRA